MWSTRLTPVSELVALSISPGQTQAVSWRGGGLFRDELGQLDDSDSSLWEMWTVPPISHVYIQ